MFGDNSLTRDFPVKDRNNFRCKDPSSDHRTTLGVPSTPTTERRVSRFLSPQRGEEVPLVGPSHGDTSQPPGLPRSESARKRGDFGDTGFLETVKQVVTIPLLNPDWSLLLLMHGGLLLKLCYPTHSGSRRRVSVGTLTDVLLGRSVSLVVCTDTSVPYLTPYFLPFTSVHSSPSSSPVSDSRTGRNTNRK